MKRCLLAMAVLLWAAPAAAQQLDCSNRAALPQIDLTACAAQDFQQWDAYLNVVYQQVINSGAVDVEALRRAQRAWIPFRDLTCEMEAGLFAGGSIAPMIHSNCLTRLTQRRSQDLESYLTN